MNPVPMTSPLPAETASAITLDLHLPLVWCTAPTLKADGVMLLRVMELLETPSQHLDEDASVEAHRWHALEARVDLCLQLLGQMLAPQYPCPPACPVTLSSTAARWQAEQPLAVGEAGSLMLYLSPRLLLPLVLPGRIEQCEHGVSGWQVQAVFTGLGEELQDWLDRTLFRHHRRSISQRRRSSHDDDVA